MTCSPTQKEPLRLILQLGLGGTLIPIDRVADQKPYYSGKHKRHGVNVQVIADAAGRLVRASPALPGSTYPTAQPGTWTPTSDGSAPNWKPPRHCPSTRTPPASTPYTTSSCAPVWTPPPATQRNGAGEPPTLGHADDRVCPPRMMMLACEN